MKHWPTLLLASLLTLTACRGRTPPDLSIVRSAQSGLRVSAALSGSGEGGPIPAALAGIRAGAFLSVIGGGEEIPPPFPDDSVGDGEAAEDIELLERILTLLLTDVRGMLNQEINREAALERYIASLASHTTRAEARFRTLENREDELRDDERRLERNIRTLQNDLEDAIQTGEGRSATALMNDILNEQTRLASIASELAVVEILVNAYQDVLEPLQERLAAVRANEDALIKGVQVVDIPGVEDLGIIRIEDGIRNLRRRNLRSGFGGVTF